MMSSSLIKAIIANNFKKVKELLKIKKPIEEIDKAINIAFHYENMDIIDAILDMYYPEVTKERETDTLSIYFNNVKPVETN